MSAKITPRFNGEHTQWNKAFWRSLLATAILLSPAILYVVYHLIKKMAS